METFSSIVQKGTKQAAALGFPTVNIPLDSGHISGIYAARVVVGEKSYVAVAFADRKRKILEAHILDSDLDLYGREIIIELYQKIRDSSAFENDDALRVAIANDIKKAREYFRELI